VFAFVFQWNLCFCPANVHSSKMAGFSINFYPLETL